MKDRIIEIVTERNPSTELIFKYYEHVTTFVDGIDSNLINRLAEQDVTDVYIYIPTDSRLQTEYIRRVGKNKCWVMKADIDIAGLDFNKILDVFEPYPIDGVYGAETFSKDITDLYDNGLRNGEYTRVWKKFDSHISFFPGQLTVVTGVSGHGKSTFVDNLMVNLALQGDYKWGLFSPENTESAYHAVRLLRQYTKKGFFHFDDNRMSKAELDSAKEFLAEYFFFIKPRPTEYHIESITERAKYLVKKHGINGMVVDPFNRIELKLRRGESETVAISRFLSHLQYLAMQLGIHIILIAHPTKVPKLEDGVNDRIPTANDIAGSVHFKNVPDNIFSVYLKRDITTGQSVQNFIYVQKIKHQFFGKLGRIEFDFDKNTETYTEGNQQW